MNRETVGSTCSPSRSRNTYVVCEAFFLRLNFIDYYVIVLVVSGSSRNSASQLSCFLVQSRRCRSYGLAPSPSLCFAPLRLLQVTVKGRKRKATYKNLLNRNYPRLSKVFFSNTSSHNGNNRSFHLKTTKKTQIGKNAITTNLLHLIIMVSQTLNLLGWLHLQQHTLLGRVQLRPILER